jgi:hypothetical protein
MTNAHQASHSAHILPLGGALELVENRHWQILRPLVFVDQPDKIPHRCA